MGLPLTLAIFDLDNTLIGGDSDHSWGEFLVEKGLVDPVHFKQANDQFYQDYLDGTLDIYAYQEFALGPIKGKSAPSLAPLHQEFMESKIAPIMLPKAAELIADHKDKGHTLLIITATNRFVTGPIAERLGIENLLATEPEIIDDHYTGKIVDIPCFQHGKIERLNAWLMSQQLEFNTLYFYSDSSNDLPLLERVTHPVVVDPDEKLRQTAEDKEWPIISLRQIGK